MIVSYLSCIDTLLRKAYNGTGAIAQASVPAAGADGCIKEVSARRIAK